MLLSKSIMEKRSISHKEKYLDHINRGMQSPHIQVIKTVDIAAPVEGDTVTYTVTVNNLSAQAATSVLVTDIVPAGVTYVPASITGGTSSNDANPDTTGLTWTVASIASGVTETFTFQATIDNQAKATYGTITNTALLTSLDQTEENPGNNASMVDIDPQALLATADNAQRNNLPLSALTLCEPHEMDNNISVDIT